MQMSAVTMYLHAFTPAPFSNEELLRLSIFFATPLFMILYFIVNVWLDELVIYLRRVIG